MEREYSSDQGEIIPDETIAELAIRGLSASICAGYLTEERAKRLFNHYFPDQTPLFETQLTRVNQERIGGQ